MTAEDLPPGEPVEVTETAAYDGSNAIVIPVKDAAEKITSEISRIIIGQQELLTQLITGLFAGGHLLVEGVPGIAKTLSARMLAQTLKLKYTRIQFTPDLMPSDVTGTSVFNMKTSDFTFNPGPVFSQIVLIDEINRAPAKTQAALFEVMEEAQVTMDGETYKMEQPFMVLATQNPIEQEGTYRLPEAQLDRFLFRIRLGYPELNEEIEILKRFRNDTAAALTGAVNSVLQGQDVLQLRSIVDQVFIKDELLEYIAKVIDQTRHDADLFLGASPRASLSLMRASKALAAIRGRAYVVPDDIKDVAYPVLNHRIQVNPEREMEGLDSNQVIKRILQSIEIPR
ncbi:MAG: MoxR family ATPase [Bacteroidetes bacterium]|nr:MoxR family ATPase [Bacteroidota bacterium]